MLKFHRICSITITATLLPSGAGRGLGLASSVFAEIKSAIKLFWIFYDLIYLFHYVTALASRLLTLFKINGAEQTAE
jgi:hypothetical protein